jgi:hypothetical protein
MFSPPRAKRMIDLLASINFTSKTPVLGGSKNHIVLGAFDVKYGSV